MSKLFLLGIKLKISGPGRQLRVLDEQLKMVASSPNDLCYRKNYKEMFLGN